MGKTLLDFKGVHVGRLVGVKRLHKDHLKTLLK